MANLYCKYQKSLSPEGRKRWDGIRWDTTTVRPKEVKTVADELPEYVEAAKRRIDYEEAVEAKFGENSGKW